jgi:hypothetical protein
MLRHFRSGNRALYRTCIIRMTIFYEATFFC